MSAMIDPSYPRAAHIAVDLLGASESMRNDQEVVRKLADARRRAARMRVAHRITPALLQLLHIPRDDTALTPLLSDAACRSNAEAVEAWVEAQLQHHPDLQLADHDVVAELVVRLRHRLFQLQDCVL